jgi:hypothetical protein
MPFPVAGPLYGAAVSSQFPPGRQRATVAYGVSYAGISSQSTPAFTAQSPARPQELIIEDNIIYWTADANKLKKNDKEYKSLPFQHDLGSEFPQKTFRLMIFANGKNFREAKGFGFIRMKCEAELAQTAPAVRFRLGIGPLNMEGRQFSAVQTHKFQDQYVASLSDNHQGVQAEVIWNLRQAVIEGSSTFLVTCEIFPETIPDDIQTYQ